MANIERVKYQNSPLIEVIFQLVFPTTLSINSQIPVEFQNSVKEKYPIYKEGVARETKVLMMPVGKPKNIMGTESKKYNFISQDGFSKVVLTSFYVSLSTLRYTQWEEFKEKVNFVIETFHRIYSPNVYTRIGLRYVNAIRKNKLGLNDRKWTELIAPHVLGIIRPDNEDGFGSYNTTAEYKSPDGITCIKPHFGLVNINNEKEASFLMDCDYFKSGITNFNEVNGIMEKLHNNSSSFIRSSITDVLHNAMRPESI